MTVRARSLNPRDQHSWGWMTTGYVGGICVMPEGGCRQLVPPQSHRCCTGHRAISSRGAPISSALQVLGTVPLLLVLWMARSDSTLRVRCGWPRQYSLGLARQLHISMSLMMGGGFWAQLIHT
uniref:Uncharacterized protein n=1 Tax=Arundo donax TaxID=35708 RepID=A0A0A8XPJ7_ARUDO